MPETITIKCPNGKGLLIDLSIPKPFPQNSQISDNPLCQNCSLNNPDNPPRVFLTPLVKNFDNRLTIRCNGQETNINLNPPVTHRVLETGVFPRGSALAT